MQLPLPLGPLPLPEAVELQAHGQRQVQQGDDPQQPVARTSPQVLCWQVLDAELSRTPGDSHRIGWHRLDSLEASLPQLSSVLAIEAQPCPLGAHGGQMMTRGPLSWVRAGMLAKA